MNENSETIGLVIHPWGQIQGKEVYLYEFSSSNGFRVSFTNYGATLQSFYIADKEGLFKDIVLGYDSLEGYIGDPFFIGSVIGRYANRISSGFVDIDGEKCTITTNEAGYHQHGGKRGFDKRVWEASVLPSDGKEDIGIERLFIGSPIKINFWYIIPLLPINPPLSTLRNIPILI
jgi:aldose 1-epimerase